MRPANRSQKPMNLFTKLQQRDSVNNPIRVGIIGAGKFGTMFLAQAIKLPGIHITGISDINPANAIANLSYVDWPADAYGATSLDDAIKNGTSFVGDDWKALIAHPAIDLIVVVCRIAGSAKFAEIYYLRSDVLICLRQEQVVFDFHFLLVLVVHKTHRLLLEFPNDWDQLHFIHECFSRLKFITKLIITFKMFLKQELVLPVFDIV